MKVGGRMIQYREIKEFKSEDLKELFLSVEWSSGQYPDKLIKAMMGSGYVASAWDGNTLIGLANALDDGEMTAYIHYALVRPEYQGKGVGRKLFGMIDENYKEYSTIVLISYGNQVPFYERLGFDAEKELMSMFKTDLKL